MNCDHSLTWFDQAVNSLRCTSCGDVITPTGTVPLTTSKPTEPSGDTRRFVPGAIIRLLSMPEPLVSNFYRRRQDDGDWRTDQPFCHGVLGIESRSKGIHDIVDCLTISARLGSGYVKTLLSLETCKPTIDIAAVTNGLCGFAGILMFGVSVRGCPHTGSEYYTVPIRAERLDLARFVLTPERLRGLPSFNLVC